METFEIEISIVVKVQAEDRNQAIEATRHGLNDALQNGLISEGDVQSSRMVAIVKDSDVEPTTETESAFMQMVGGISKALETAGLEAVERALEKDGGLNTGDLGGVVHTLATWAQHKEIGADTVVQIWLDGNLPEEAWGHDLES